MNKNPSDVVRELGNKVLSGKMSIEEYVKAVNAETKTLEEKFIKLMDDLFESTVKNVKLTEMLSDFIDEESEQSMEEDFLGQVMEERLRQESKGYSAEHDFQHMDGSIADAAAHYAATKDIDGLYPWDKQYDSKSKHDKERLMVISATMLMAEYVRLQYLKKFATRTSAIAAQWTGENSDEIEMILGRPCELDFNCDPFGVVLDSSSLEPDASHIIDGRICIPVGDYIVRLSSGEIVGYTKNRFEEELQIDQNTPRIGIQR